MDGIAVTRFYFDQYEDRRPPPPLKHSPWREGVWQYLAVVNLVLGAWYLHWRWSQSLNLEALWFAIPLVVAETLSFVGLILFTVNLWKSWDPPSGSPPANIDECAPGEATRPLSVDIFIATYNEDEELVRLSIIDAKAVTYPHPIDIKIFVLDDGRRAAMRQVCEEEGVGYISRDNNLGYKAGNLRNGMEQTSGDFIVICDADTRMFPSFLENTLGYFRDPDMAFVQTPHWFYDLPQGAPLPAAWGAKAGFLGRWAGRAVELVIGEVRVGEDPFGQDPKMFFDVILRRRNWANAVFCCGAGSIHRREAVMYAALRAYAEAVAIAGRDARRQVRRHLGERRLDPEVELWVRRQAADEIELTPYKFHVSEDIFTSIVLHQDRTRRWKSALHAKVESKMLSPQDLLSLTVQRFKYAGGSLDIFFHANPIFGPGLSLAQRIMYLATFWSYFAAIWSVCFLLAPIVYFATGQAPVSAYTADFFLHLLPFLAANELAFMVGTWGVAGFKGKVNYLATFPISIQAVWTVLRGKTIKFPVTPKTRQAGNFLPLVGPQAAIIVLTLSAALFAVWRWWSGAQGYTLGGLIANGFWSAYNIMAMAILVTAAFWSPPPSTEEDDHVAR